MSICVCVHICVNNTRQEHEGAPGAGQARCQLLPAPGVGLARCKHRLIRVHPRWGRSGPDGELGTATSPGWWLEKVREAAKAASELPEPWGAVPRGWVPLVPGVLGLCRLQPGSLRDETSPCFMAEMRGSGEQRDLVEAGSAAVPRSSVSYHTLPVFPKY